MNRIWKVPFILSGCIGMALAADSVSTPDFAPAPTPMFPTADANAAPAPAAVPEGATPAPAADTGWTSNSAPAPAPVPEVVAEPAPAPIEVVPQAPLATDPKSVQLRKEQAIIDSITAVDASISASCATVAAQLPALTPKDEFETSDAYAKRKAAWEKNRDDKCAAGVKPLKQKKEALQLALKKLQDAAEEMKGSIELRSEPAGAKVLIDGKVVGITPYTAEKLWAGQTKVIFSKEGFEDFIASVEVKGDDEIELSATLQEKSIFSPVNEVNLSALLAKDTASVLVYQARIVVLQNRIAEVKGEIAVLLQELDLKDPLAPKGEFETELAFNQRKTKWTKSHQEKIDALKAKHLTYQTRLSRAIEVLQDYIVVQAGVPKPLAIPNTAMTLASYNADAGKYSMVTEYTRDGFAFHYEGTMQMGVEEAKATNKQTAGFDIKANYYDIPVAWNGSTVYPAWHSLDVSKAGKKFPTEGKFKLPAEWLADAQVAAAVQRADSLRKGLIEARNLNADYALNYGAKGSSNCGRVVAWVVRGVLLSAGAAGITYGYLQHKEVKKMNDDYNPRNKEEGVTQLQDIRDKEKVRDRALFAGAILTIAGAVAFAF